MIRNRYRPDIQQQLNSLPGRVRADVEAALDQLEFSPRPHGWPIISNSPQHIMKVNNTTEILYVSDRTGDVTIVGIRRRLWSGIRASAGI
jgi:hypothetical protein